MKIIKPSMADHAQLTPKRYIGFELTIVVNRKTEILWVGDSDWHVGGYIDVTLVRGQVVKNRARVIASEIQLQNATGEVFRP
ncbi:MAG: hypothetical protein ACJ757_04200 [Gaiellaceae bacterium]